MKGLTTIAKQEVLKFFLHTAVERIVKENRIKKQTDSNNPCYACIKAYLDSTKIS